MKEHKTFDQQLRILRDRGMTVPKNGQPKRFLEQENYYNVVNGYKDLFLKRDANNRPITPEQYIAGTHFRELQNLFLFDRELRILFLKYLLIFENSIKTTIAYEFSKKYPRKNAYLDLSNFVDDKPKKVLQQISILTKTIHDKVDKSDSVKHYIEKHGEVPLWVLVNFLTIGNMAHFYSILTDSLKNRISKFYSDKYNKHYKPSSRLTMTASDMESALKVVNLIRNICAHDERLYNVNLKKVRIANIADYHQVANYNNKRLIVTILFLKTVLDKKHYQSFHRQLNSVFSKYRQEFHTVSFDSILDIMGIDEAELDKLA